MSIFPTKILLATDGSKDAWLATNTAIGIAMVTRSELHIVNVGVVAPALLKPLDVEPTRVEKEARRVLDEEVKNIENVGGHGNKKPPQNGGCRPGDREHR